MAVSSEELKKARITKKQAKLLVSEAYDLHVHGPDNIPRKYNDNPLSLLEEKGSLAGLVLKSHFYKNMIDLAKKLTLKKFPVFGSISLNNGFDLSLLNKAIKEAGVAPFFVWGPTFAAKAFLDKQEEYAIPESWVKGTPYSSIKKADILPITCISENGSLTKDCLEFLKKLKKTKGILASGHLGSKETYLLGLEARKNNIPFIATHALLGDKSPLTEKQMTNLINVGAYLEFCHIFLRDEDYDGKYNRKQIVRQIKRFSDGVIISSDCGQPRNPGPSTCLIECVQVLSGYGLTFSEIKKVIIENPKKILFPN